MSSEPHRYVEPELSEARIDRLWLKLKERSSARPSRRWRYALLGAALAGAAAGALVFARQKPELGAAAQQVASDAKLETTAQPLAVTLVDGSSVKLGSHSQLNVRESRPTQVALALSRGEVTCDVTHREGRSFSVVADDVEVRVVGTLFRVKATPEAAGSRVEVSVLRGVVEVHSRRRPGIVARVAAGQSWLQLPESARAASEPVAVELAPTNPVAAPEAQRAESAAAASAAPPGSSARELFEKAGERRRAGDAAGAAHAYEELLRAHPGDARASLAAFELGRLRMDRLGDQAGAVSALERAVAQNVGPSFREDALARLVSVYAAQGNFGACARARDRYLASYPSGIHAAAVATRCGSR